MDSEIVPDECVERPLDNRYSLRLMLQNVLRLTEHPHVGERFGPFTLQRCHIRQVVAIHEVRPVPPMPTPTTVVPGYAFKVIPGCPLDAETRTRLDALVADRE